MIKKNTKQRFIKVHKDEKKSNSILDRFGFAVSFLCLIHCIALPVLLLLLPSYSILLGSWHGSVHFYLYLIILPVSLAAFLPRVFRDKQWEFLWGPGCAVILLGLTMYLHQLEDLPFDTFIEPSLTSLASFTLIYFHWRNYKLKNHKCPKC